MRSRGLKFRYIFVSALTFVLLIATAIGAGQENHLYKEDLALIVVLATIAYFSAFLDGAIHMKNHMISQTEEDEKDE